MGCRGGPFAAAEGFGRVDAEDVAPAQPFADVVRGSDDLLLVHLLGGAIGPRSARLDEQRRKCGSHAMI